MERTRRLILVRHAAVDVRADARAETWRLSDEGRAAAAELAGWPGWERVTLVASSPEAKALETATPLAAAAGVEPQVEEDLREARRPAQPLGSRTEYVALASAYLGGFHVDGWEPAARVRARVTACVERLLAPGEGDVAIVSHGLALSLFLGLDPDGWGQIPFPGLAVVEAGTLRVLEPWRANA